MKKIVWVAGLLLLLSVVFPNGLSLTNPVNTKPPGATDAKIVELLSKADAADKARVEGVYSGLVYVLKRDNGGRVTTTEKWEEVQQNTLDLAIETVGKYPGLDEAIESVFLKAVGTDDVMPNNPEVLAKLIAACETIANSAAK
jgi:hypothetical protein